MPSNYFRKIFTFLKAKQGKTPNPSLTRRQLTDIKKGTPKLVCG
jgi:hypothetical protein